MRRLFSALLIASLLPAPAGAGERELEILCLNLWGLAWPLSKDREERMGLISEALNFERYDFVGLQEVWSGALRYLPRDLVRLPEARGDSGLAIAGRLAAGAPMTLHAFERVAGIEHFKRKGILSTRLEVPGVGPVQVYVTHFQAGPPYGRVRRQQAEQLLGLVSQDSLPALVIGDFNLHLDHPEDEATEALLAGAGLKDAALLAGTPGSTYRGDNPYVWRMAAGERFDRVYLKDGADASLELLEVEVLDYDRPLSDHQPLRVVVKLVD